MTAENTITAEGQYKIEDWKEEPTIKLPTPQKATRAEIELTFSGDLIGTSQLTYLLAYNHDEHSHFTGIQYFSGELNGKKGSFVLLEQGEYKNKKVTSHWRIAEGSGTDELTGISGSGGYIAGHAKVVDWTLKFVINSHL